MYALTKAGAIRTGQAKAFIELQFKHFDLLSKGQFLLCIIPDGTFNPGA